MNEHEKILLYKSSSWKFGAKEIYALSSHREPSTYLIYPVKNGGRWRIFRLSDPKLVPLHRHTQRMHAVGGHKLTHGIKVAPCLRTLKSPLQANLPVAHIKSSSIINVASITRSILCLPMPAKIKNKNQNLKHLAILSL